MRIITGTRENIRKYIETLYGSEIIFPEHQLDISEQSHYIQNLPEYFDLDIITLSPWIISDSDNIYIINNDLTLEKCEHKTFGTSIIEISSTIFNWNYTIAGLAALEIDNSTKHLTTIEDYHKSKLFLSRFGESIEKFEAYNILNKFKRRIEE